MESPTALPKSLLGSCFHVSSAWTVRTSEPRFPRSPPARPSRVPVPGHRYSPALHGRRVVFLALRLRAFLPAWTLSFTAHFRSVGNPVSSPLRCLRNTMLCGPEPHLPSSVPTAPLTQTAAWGTLLYLPLSSFYLRDLPLPLCRSSPEHPTSDPSPPWLYPASTASFTF